MFIRLIRVMGQQYSVLFRDGERRAHICLGLPEQPENHLSPSTLRPTKRYRVQGLKLCHQANQPVLRDFTRPSSRARLSQSSALRVGKSTLIRLLVRFCDVNDGTILSMARTSTDTAAASYGSGSASLQDFHIFSGSILENKIGNPAISPLTPSEPPMLYKPLLSLSDYQGL